MNVLESGHLHADILEVGVDSYFYIALIDSTSDKLYQQMVSKMELAVREQSSAPRQGRLTMQPGMDCILNLFGRRGGAHVRGRILELIPQSQYVYCYLVDDCFDDIVHISQIFRTTPEISKIPSFAMKCRLVGMDCFIGYPTLQTVYRKYQNSSRKPSGCDRCIVKVLNTSKTPTVRLQMRDGKDLTNVLQQLIWQTQGFKHPKPGVPITAKITHCDNEGTIWYRPSGQNDDVLIKAVKARLDAYARGLPLQPNGLLSATANLNNLHTDGLVSGMEKIYIYIDANREGYRVKLEWDFECKFYVFFIDYGYKRLVTMENFTQAELVDPTLRFIPPQCLPVKFIGANCIGVSTYDGGMGEFDQQKFRKFANDRNQVSILIKNKVGLYDDCMIPVADVLVRSGPPLELHDEEEDGQSAMFLGMDSGQAGYSLGGIFHSTNCPGQGHLVCWNCLFARCEKLETEESDNAEGY